MGKYGKFLGSKRTLLKLLAAGTLIILVMVAFSGSEKAKAGSYDTTVALYDSAKIGVVSRVLNLSLEKGVNRIPLEELSGLDVEEITIRPLNESVQFLGLYSEESGEDLYKSNVGGNVEVKLSDGSVVAGEFLGLKEGKLLIKSEDSIYAADPSRLIYFKISKLPKKGGTYASFLAEKEGSYPVEVIYRVSGMEWKSRYKLYINGNTASLLGYIVVSNPTSKDFEGAKVVLVSGDVNFYGASPRTLYETAAMKAEEPSNEPVKVEAFHVYPLGPIDISSGSKFTLPYITADFKIEREYLYESWAYSRETPVYESISFKTDRALPKGVVELYREEPTGTLLIGESHIEHTPKGDTVRLGVGKDYDLRGITEVLEYNHDGNSAQYKIRITVKNFGDEDKHVVIRHYKYGGKLLSSTVSPSDETTSYVEFQLDVPAGGSKSVTFEYRVSW